MAAVTLTGTPSLATQGPHLAGHSLGGLLAGEAIFAGAVCYVKNDGKVWLATGAAANAAAKVRGMALQAAAVGEAVSLYYGVRIRYGAGMTPGADLFLSTGGLIVDAATTGGTAPIGYVVSATVIEIWQSRY
jgi:alpha-beta hydrolase superfamily lysophospholipase